MPGVKVGHVDIQFSKDWDSVKANQLVQSLQQTISAVNQLAGTIVAPTPPGVAVHVLATAAALGPDHTVSGLTSGQVLVATSPVTAHFAALDFGQMAKTDSGTFVAPNNGDIIAFVNGYWSATPIAGALGLTDPGSNALLMWNEATPGLQWAIPGVGIVINPGNVAVDDTQLVHGHLLGLLADDHPQYALVADTPLLDGLNVFTLVNTFQQGIISNGDIVLTGNLEQSGPEGTEWRIVNTADNPNEGGWRTHVETGQLIFSTVQDDGTDGENWMSVQRNAELVDTISLEAQYLTFNGADVITQDKAKPPAAGYLPVLVAGVAFNLLTASFNTVAGGFYSQGDINLAGNLEQVGVEGTEWRLTNVNDYANEGAWRTHVETGQLIFSTCNDDGSDGENWCSVQRIGELVETIAFQANSGSMTFNGFDVLCATAPAPGQPYIPVWLAGTTYNLQLMSTTGGGGGSGTVTSVGLSTVSGTVVLTGTNPVTTAGTIGVDLSTAAQADLVLASTALQPIGGLSGSYTNSNITLNASGQITAISNGSGGGTPANPTALVALSAVNGVLTTYMRSDAAPALDQSIAPTWTGAHNFAANTATPVVVGGIAVTGGNTLTVSNTSAAAGDTCRIQISTPTSAVALFAGNAATVTPLLTGGPTGAQSVLRNLGTYPMVFGIQNNMIAFFSGTTGELQLQPLATPTNGAIFIKSKNTGDLCLQLQDPGANATQLLVATNNSGEVSYKVTGTVASQGFYTNGVSRMTVNSGGGVTISAPAANTPLTINSASAGISIACNAASQVAQFAQLATIGSSGGDYPTFGYNFLATAVAGSYKYAATDFSAGVQFTSGQIIFKTAPSGTVGNTITYATALLITNAGALKYNASQTVAASAAINTTETYISAAYSLPANFLTAGQRFRIRCWGTCTTTVGNLSTFTVRLGAAGTTADLAISSTITATAGTTGTNIPFHLDIDVVIRVAGASGTTAVTGVLMSNGITGIANVAGPLPGPTGVTTAINMTGALKLGISYKTAATTTTSTFQSVSVHQVI